MLEGNGWFNPSDYNTDKTKFLQLLKFRKFSDWKDYPSTTNLSKAVKPIVRKNSHF